METPQLDWGGFVDTLNYWPREDANPQVAASRLNDPAYVESFTWTVQRYPGRIAALELVADAPFKNDLIRIMRRRLAVGRVLPLAVEYFERRRAGRADAEETLARIADERRAWDEYPDAARILDSFFEAAGVPLNAGPP